MRKFKIYVVGNSKYYTRWIENHELVNTIEEADIVFFTGGEDVHPSMYNAPETNPKTYANLERDIYEKQFWNKAVAQGKFILGVCRGSQFSCAMSGGLLVQHCNNHGIWGTHKMIMNDGRILEITSTHHQMMFPYNLPEDDYELIGWSDVIRSKVHESVEWKEEYKEPEVVFFKKTRALGIQGHPEMMDLGCETHEYLNNLINKLF